MSSGNILSKIIPNLNFMSKCHCLRLNFKKLMLYFGRGSAFGYIKIYNQQYIYQYINLLYIAHIAICVFKKIAICIRLCTIYGKTMYKRLNKYLYHSEYVKFLIILN